MRMPRRGALIALEQDGLAAADGAPEETGRRHSLDDAQLRQVVHELNNLLTVINGYADVLLDDFADHAPARQLAMIRDAGKRAAALVAELRARGQRAPFEAMTSARG